MLYLTVHCKIPWIPFFDWYILTLLIPKQYFAYASKSVKNISLCILILLQRCHENWWFLFRFKQLFHQYLIYSINLLWKELIQCMSEHTGLISSCQLLITAACTNTGSEMKGSCPRAADWCPFVPRHSEVRLPLPWPFQWYDYCAQRCPST